MPDRSPSTPATRAHPRRIALVVTYAVFLFLIIEVPLRIYATVHFDAPFFRPSEILYAYYPNLKTATLATMPDPANHLDVLLLGGSVLRMEQQQIRRILEPQLVEASPLPVRIHNVATSAHTTLDSLYKYRQLQHRPFDFVILYHSINEVRANNCPPEAFRADYSHNIWYEHVNLLLRHPEINLTVIPYFLEKTIIILGDKFGYKEYIPHNNVRADWTQYGADIKTQWPFAENLRNVISIADRNNHQFVLMTFSYYVPENYSLEAFERDELDYFQKAHPIEMWGKPENVVKGLEVHNQSIREIHEEHPDLLYVDQDRSIPKAGENFHDICHFSQRGCELFVANLMEVLGPAVRGVRE